MLDVEIVVCRCPCQRGAIWSRKADPGAASNIEGATAARPSIVSPLDTDFLMDIGRLSEAFVICVLHKSTKGTLTTLDLRPRAELEGRSFEVEIFEVKGDLDTMFAQRAFSGHSEGQECLQQENLESVDQPQTMGWAEMLR